MTSSATALRHLYTVDRSDALFHRCLKISGTAAGLFLLTVLLAPLRQQTITRVDELPQRFARLIVEKPKPRPAPPVAVTHAATEAPVVETPRAAPAPAPKPAVQPIRRRPDAPPPVDPDAGRAGRERAQQAVADKLAGTTATLDKTLENLTSSLRTSNSDAPTPGARRRGRAVRAGRGSDQVGGVQADIGSGGTADLGGSAVEGSWVAVGTLSSGTGSAGGVEGGTGDASAMGSGAAPGVYRSNASLLAVIQKYAPGIQYCYGNELKRQAGLHGKMIVSLTVAASGEVTASRIVSNTLGSERLAACALAQIRDWKFPPVSGGSTTFQAPFVFTPPQ